MPKYGAPQPDEDAAVIIALGERASASLVERITDEKPSRWLAWGSVGDVAHVILTVIHNLHWPSYEFTEMRGLRADDSYHEYYVAFLKERGPDERREERKNLQQAWRQVIERHCWRESIKR